MFLGVLEVKAGRAYSDHCALKVSTVHGIFWVTAANCSSLGYSAAG
jgi:hypothetical protein